ncbi:hypothetical protein DKX38_029624 [Salix brachista]|uniref:Uncharacterized protein n=1 Tax=Salix brachista TaxID=2182728 RepID=A0A5N5J1Z0_9ROSI|nr:hypothetical protein DKX38_029624 [Salix brachista]
MFTVCISLPIWGLRWYAKRLRIDEDGDVANEFFDEVLPDTSSSIDEHHKPLPRGDCGGYNGSSCSGLLGGWVEFLRSIGRFAAGLFFKNRFTFCFCGMNCEDPGPNCIIVHVTRLCPIGNGFKQSGRSLSAHCSPSAMPRWQHNLNAAPSTTSLENAFLEWTTRIQVEIAGSIAWIIVMNKKEVSARRMAINTIATVIVDFAALS